MSIFFQGALQSAVEISLQFKREFAAFVCVAQDDNDGGDGDVAATCASWEQNLVTNELTRNYFDASSVLLKIHPNSAEYGHLSAFVPDIKTPSVIILRQGQISHRFNDFEALLQHCQLFDRAMQWQRQAAEQAAEQSGGTGSSQDNLTIPPEPVSHTQSATPGLWYPVSAPLPQPQTESTRPTSTTQLTQPVDEPPAPQTSRGQPSVQTPLSADPPAARSSASRSWAVEQRERNLEARRERDRILAQIESDKRARKARATKRRNVGDHTESTNQSSSPNKKNATTSNNCRIQVRLISGRTIRTTLNPSATPASDLRPWIDTELASDTEGPRVPAYRLKRMGVPPEPTREIGLSEEQESLSELGLLPSATLVVTPIHGAADAYSDTGSGWGLLSLPVSVVGGAASMAMGAVGAVGGALSSTLGYGGAGRPEEQASRDERPTATGNAARVRTLHEVRGQNDREDQNFYNGNQLSFQPNDADDK